MNLSNFAAFIQSLIFITGPRLNALLQHTVGQAPACIKI